MSADLVLGTAQLGSAYGINNAVGELNEQQAVALLDAAAASHVQLLDTAEGYGNSQQVIGAYFKNHPNCGFKICTKLTGSFDSNASEALEALRTRLQNAKAALNDCPIDIYYLHSFALCHDLNLMNALAALRDEGYFEKIGISIYDPTELVYILDNLADIVDAVQIPLNVFNASSWLEPNILQQARQANIVLLVRSVYVQGLIFKEPDDDFIQKLGLDKALAAFIEDAKKAGVSRAQYACDYVRGLNEISYLILGCETTEQLEDNVRIFESPNSWTDEQRRMQLERSRTINQQSIDPRTW